MSFLSRDLAGSAYDARRPRLNFVGPTICAAGFAVIILGALFDDHEILGVGMLVLGLLFAGRLLHVAYLRNKKFCVTRFYAYSVGTQYFLGSGFALVASENYSTLINGIGSIEPFSMMWASLYILCFIGVLIWLGRFEIIQWRKIIGSLLEQENYSSSFVGFLAIIFGFQFLSLISGYWSFGGLASGEDGELPVTMSLLASIAAPLVGVCGWMLGQWNRKLSLPMAVVLVGVPLQLIWAMAQGRRVLVFTLFALFLGYLSRSPKGLTWKRVTGYAVVGVAIAFLGGMLFYSMRLAVWRTQDFMSLDRAALGQQLAAAADLINRDQSEVLKEVADNVLGRSYVIGILSSVIYQGSEFSSLYGRELISQLLLSVPRAVVPMKMEVISNLGLGSGLIVAFGLNSEDSAKSFVISSYGDFGFLGALIYPLLILIMAKIYIIMINFAKGYMSKVYLLFYVFCVFIVVEEQPAFWFDSLRNLLIASPFLLLFVKGASGARPALRTQL